MLLLFATHYIYTILVNNNKNDDGDDDIDDNDDDNFTCNKQKIALEVSRIKNFNIRTECAFEETLTSLKFSEIVTF